MKPKIPDVRLGFEVGSGEPVMLPIRHMCVTGQTQEAGKTTALEALITRSGLRAVTFITKRGEGSFAGARRIDPYFREQADWQFVASILEASRGEKLKFERAWIIRASKGATTLAEVQANVQKALLTAKGMSADVYLTLDAYLEVVVPAIAAIRWAPRLELHAGVNAIDLTGVPLEMQHLVIKSCLTWVLEREENTVVVVPEAWKYIPQGRGTPVKLAAQALIRQGAALRNYLWIDSQDIGGIDKETLRSVPVWLLGVQREANEIKRTLDNIPDGVTKPKKADIATLALGHFVACFSRSAIKTYVQPAWMSAETAQHVAMGHVHAGTVRGDLLPPPTRPATFPDHIDRAGHGHSQKDPAVTPAEAERLLRENTELKESNERLQRANDLLDDQLGVLSSRLEAIEGRGGGARPAVDLRTAADLPSPLPPIPSTAAVLERSDLAEEEKYQRFKRRLLSEIQLGGATVIELTPPAKLRADFQRAEVDRILQIVRELNPLARKTLKLLESLEGRRLTQVNINERLGRSPQSKRDMSAAVSEMTDLGFLNSDKNGTAACVRAKIAADLATYSPTDADIDACHQAVLHVLATDASL